MKTTIGNAVSQVRHSEGRTISPDKSSAAAICHSPKPTLCDHNERSLLRGAPGLEGHGLSISPEPCWDRPARWRLPHYSLHFCLLRWCWFVLTKQHSHQKQEGGEENAVAGLHCVTDKHRLPRRPFSSSRAEPSQEHAAAGGCVHSLLPAQPWASQTWYYFRLWTHCQLR